MDILTKSLSLASRVLGHYTRATVSKDLEGEVTMPLREGRGVREGMGEGCNHVMIRTLVLFIRPQTSSVN